jgi:hypothetical protein
MKNKRFASFLAVVACGGIGLLPIQANARTNYQTSLVPNVAGSTPGFSAKGSSLKISGSHLALKGKIKNVVDDTGARITTDALNPADNYSVEVDLSVPHTAATSTVVVSFDLKNGNGKFSTDLSSDPAIDGATAGDGVAVEAVRVKDAAGNVIGHGGFAKP